VKRTLALALLLISCGPRAAPPVIDPRLAAQVPADASALAGLRPSALGPLATSFGDARYVLTWVHGSDMSSAILAADGSVTGVSAAGGPASALVAQGETLAGNYPAWAAIRGGTRLPLSGNLTNLNNLLVDADLLTVGVRPGARFAVDLTANCPTESNAEHLAGSLRAVLLLIKAEGATVRRDGQEVRASMKVPAEVMGRLVR